MQAQAGELVRQGNIRIAVSVLHQLHHLRGGGIREQDFTSNKEGVEIPSRL